MHNHQGPGSYRPQIDPLWEWRQIKFLAWIVFLPALCAKYGLHALLSWILQRSGVVRKRWYWVVVASLALFGSSIYVLLSPWQWGAMSASSVSSGSWGMVAFFAGLCWVSLILFSPAILLLEKLVPQGHPEQRLIAGMEQKKTMGQGMTAHIRNQAKNAPQMLAGEIVLGVNIGGDFPEWVKTEKKGSWCLYPEAFLRLPAVMIGESRSGKTNTVLKLASLAVTELKWNVVYVDAKGDDQLARDFLVTMRQAGLSDQDIGIFPYQHYNGWFGDNRTILNRIEALIQTENSYYKDLFKRMLKLALYADSPPRTSSELIERMYLEYLQDAYKHRPAELLQVRSISKEDAAGARNRILAFFDSLDSDLDGSWSFDSKRASYILLRGLALREETQTLGGFFIEEIANYAAFRKGRDQPVLIILDDSSALKLGTEVAGLVERLAGYNAPIILAAQSYEGLGPNRAQIVGAAGVRFLHRCSDPEAIVGRAGMQYEIRQGVQAEGGVSTGRSTLSVWERSKIHPDTVKRLEAGELIIISKGKAHQLYVAPLWFEESKRASAQQYIDSLQQAQYLVPPTAGGTNLWP